MRLNLKKKYILSYAFIVLAVIALMNMALIPVSVNALNNTLEQEQTERGRLLAADMEAQLGSFLDIRNDIKTRNVFQPLYQRKYYTRRLELIDALNGYSTYLLTDVELYLLYRQEDGIYFEKTCADWETFSRIYWEIDRKDPLKEVLYENMETQILRPESLSGDLLFVLPFTMGYGENREELCLFFRVPQASVHERLQRVSGLRPEEYSVAFDGQLLLGDQPYEWQTLASAEGRFTIGLSGISDEAYAQLTGIQRMLLLLCAGFTVVSLAVAVCVALRQYQPIGFMVQRVGGEPKEKNELAYIEQVISDTLRENDRVKRDIFAQMDSLMNQSEIIELQTVKLRRQLLLLLLLGVYHSQQDLPAELLAMFRHPSFAVLKIWDAEEATAAAVERCSDARRSFFAVPMVRQNWLAVLVNLEPDDDMFEIVTALSRRLESSATIFSGEIVDLEGVSASFLHVSVRPAVPETNSADDLLLSKECQEMFQAVRLGHRETAIARANDFSSMLLRRQLPLIEMKRIYLILLKKLQNLAEQLECSISEENAAALTLSLSPEAFAENLARCLSDLCDGEPADDRTQEALDLMQYIDEHACERDMSLPMIEEAFGMSRKKATTLVKRMTGMGFREYVVYQRIERAKLLLNTKLSISAISELCGYESPSYFIKSFKNMTGKTPGQFQKDGM